MSLQAQSLEAQVDIMQLRKLQMAQMAIASLYVDSVNQEKLVEDAIRGMLDKLDPHSEYSSAEETKKLTEPLNGNFEGIGVQFNMLDDTLVVIQTIHKGPSEKVGIRSGDRIVMVNGVAIAGVQMPRDSIVSRLRGPKGTHANLKVVRRGVVEPLLFDVVRDKIPLNTLDAAYMLTPTVGYIRLESFGNTTGTETRDAIKNLKKKGMKDLVLDLQDNGGGYLGAAVEVAEQFLHGGDKVVYTQGRTDEPHYLFASAGGLFREGRLVVLVDELTASAAEIVSGAVQDYDRGTIVGRRTFGKGLVQRPIPMPDNSMIRLTVAHYYTPSGRCIQKPYVKGKKTEYGQDIEERYKHGELICKDSIRLDSANVFYTLNEGRKVYGGGGIMPDVFVPLDTATYSKYYIGLRRINAFNDVALKYTDSHRAALLKQYAKSDDFIARYQVPAALLDEVEKLGADKKVVPADESDRLKTRSDVEFMLKALILYDLFDRSAYFQFVNQRSDVLKRALELLQP